jgi:hypothetical protein
MTYMEADTFLLSHCIVKRETEPEACGLPCVRGACKKMRNFWLHWHSERPERKICPKNQNKYIGSRYVSAYEWSDMTVFQVLFIKRIEFDVQQSGALAECK